MTNRSAHATIKGYFYQFDQTIVRLLEATSSQSSVVVEGIEDIDLDDSDESAFIQCKYYEGSEYNHSIIKDAVIQMLKHFQASGCRADQKFKYRLYGHYKKCQEKLPVKFDLDFLKVNFLTYTHKKIRHEVHLELKVSDAQLVNFLNLLEINLHAQSYDKQQKHLNGLLASQIPSCNSVDAEIFYYPSAVNVIQKLAVQANEKDRKITKAQFVSQVNRKEIVFSLWLRQKFGDDYYAKQIKRQYFRFPSTKVPKASRIFVIDMTDEFELSKAVSLLIKIGTTFSHVEHKRTPQHDRFCPYILLCGVQPQELVSLKQGLLDQGVKFSDGHPFNGSSFSPELLAAAPTKENLIRLKFISSTDQIPPAVSAAKGTIIQIFDFFKLSHLAAKNIPAGISHNKIKIDSAYFINEVL